MKMVYVILYLCAWVTVVPTAKDMPTEDNRKQTDDEDSEREETHTEDTRIEGENVTYARREYAAGRIQRHVGKSNNVKYVVR